LLRREEEECDQLFAEQQNDDEEQTNFGNGKWLVRTFIADSSGGVALNKLSESKCRLDGVDGARMRSGRLEGSRDRDAVVRGAI
jgi:hypothetical protein